MVTVWTEGLMEHDDLAAVRPAYRLLRDKLADLDRARDRLQELIDGFEGLYPALAQEDDGNETPETAVETPQVVTNQPTMEKPVAPAETPAPTDTSTPELVPVPEATPAHNDFIPRGKQAVVMVMSEQPGRWFSAQDVLRAMDQRGWTPRSETPDQALRAVRTALLRAWRAGQIENKPVDGRTLNYRVPPKYESAEVTPRVT
jgi:hypothetical protein